MQLMQHLHATGVVRYYTQCIPRENAMSRKVLYHFAMLAIINEILTFKDSRIRVRPTYLLNYYLLKVHRAHGARNGDGLTDAIRA